MKIPNRHQQYVKTTGITNNERMELLVTDKDGDSSTKGIIAPNYIPIQCQHHSIHQLMYMSILLNPSVNILNSMGFYSDQQGMIINTTASVNVPHLG